MQRGFTIVEVLIVLTVIAVLVAIAIPELHQARIRAEVGALAGDGRMLYLAFKQFYIDHGRFPDTSTLPAFDVATFEPLRSDGYYRGNINRLLLGNQPDGYDAPSDGGINQEFWLEMTLHKDPSVRFVVAHSDDAPLGGGQWLDGVYLFRNGVLSKL